MTPDPEEMEKMAKELKPCPFCGGVDLEVCNTHTPSYWVECHDCGAKARGDSFRYTEKQHNDFHSKPLPRPYILAKESAIAAWNRRSDAAQEADFQARLAPWVAWLNNLAYTEVMKECRICAQLGGQVDPRRGDEHLRECPLSSPDALRAQSREAEIRAEAFEEAADMLASHGEKPLTPNAIRLRWANNLTARAVAERAKAKAAHKPKEK